MAPLPVTAVILAGGKASRMHGVDKGLITLGDKPLIEHVIARLQPQVQQIIISANRNLDTYRQFGLPVLTDQNHDYLGPLAGIATAMQQCTTEYLLVQPCDCPFLPHDLAEKMTAAIIANNADVCLAFDGRRLQPLVALLSVSLLDRLDQSIAAGKLKVERWMLEQDHCMAEFKDPQAFLNINTAQELEQAEKLLQAQS